jgi:uncharacterized protein (DUF2132 family)
MQGASGGDSDEDEDDADYEKLTSVPGNHYARLQTQSTQPLHSLQSEHIYTKLNTKVGDVSTLTRHDRKCTHSQTSMHSKSSQLLDLQAKLNHMKKDNIALQQHVASLKSRVNHLKLLETAEKKVISSLSCIETVSLLEGFGLGAYRQKFIDEQVEGYRLAHCERDFLLDLGMRHAHVCKLLAILKRRLSHCVSWRDK